MGEVACVAGVRKLTRPCERVERARVDVVALDAQIVPIVLDVLAPASPTDRLLLGIRLTVEERPHAHVVQAVRFH